MSDLMMAKNAIAEAVKQGLVADAQLFQKFGKDISFFHRKQVVLGTTQIPTVEFFTEAVDNLVSNLGKGGSVPAPFLCKAASISIWTKGAVTEGESYDLLEVLKGSRFYQLRDSDRVIDFSTEAIYEIDQLVAGGTSTANTALSVRSKMKPINGQLIWIPDNIFKGYMDYPVLAAALTVEVAVQLHGLILK